MKIGIDGRAAKWYRGTGIGTYTYELINFLGKMPEIFSYYVHMPKNINFPHYNNIKIITSIDHNKENFWDEIRTPNCISSLDVDLYHIPQNGIGMPIPKKCPYIITLHDIIPCKLPETVNPKFLKLFEETMPQILEKSDGVITVSNFSKNDIINTFNYPKDKIFVTPLASEKIYMPLDKLYSKKIIKINYGIDDPFILYIGGLSPRKNITRLIEAFELLKRKYKKNIKLVIAGKKGTNYEAYRKKVQSFSLEDHIIFPGFIKMEHMPYIYNASELFVYPSLYEGFGLPPIEAMACGVPVISSNITSMPEILKNAAILINPRDSYALSEKIYEVLTNKSFSKELSVRGLKKAKELNWEKTASLTLEAYKEIYKQNKNC